MENQLEQNWGMIEDAAQRKRVQNRLAQRKHRRKAQQQDLQQANASSKSAQASASCSWELEEFGAEDFDMADLSQPEWNMGPRRSIDQRAGGELAGTYPPGLDNPALAMPATSSTSVGIKAPQHHRTLSNGPGIAGPLDLSASAAAAAMPKPTTDLHSQLPRYFFDHYDYHHGGATPHHQCHHHTTPTMTHAHYPTEQNPMRQTAPSTGRWRTSWHYSPQDSPPREGSIHELGEELDGILSKVETQVAGADPSKHAVAMSQELRPSSRDDKERSVRKVKKLVVLYFDDED